MRVFRVWLLCAAVAGPLSAQVPPVAPAPAGRLVPVNGHRLWISCAGAEGPTVVVDYGGGSDGTEWRATVAELRREARVCVYARAGYPPSEPGPFPRDAGREADELAALLTAAAVPRPFLLVAHSLGALNAMVLAQRHRDWLTGLVVLDPPPFSWLNGTTFPAIRTGVEATVTRVRQRVVTLRGAADSASLVRAHRSETLASELESMFAGTATAASAVRTLGDLPVLALAGGRPDTTAYGADAAAFTNAWIEQARAIAALSSRGEFVLVAESGHNVPAQVPDRVTAAVRTMLARVAR
jgi:pimeloyl-ACP methyl ester carboxylesterase